MTGYDDLVVRVEERIAGLQAQLKTIIAAHAELHSHEQHATKLAKAEVDRRLEAMNEFRAQITSERGQFLSREQADLMRESTERRMQSLENSRANMEGKLWGVGFLIALVSIGGSVLLRML